MKQLLIIFIWMGLIINAKAQSPQDVSHQLTSSYFQEQREITVHLPKAYDPKEALPIIYLFDAQWKPFYTLTTAIVDYLIEIRAFPKCMVVGIHANARQYELTPAPVNEDWKVPNLGGAKLLENHLVHEVKPLLDSLYNPAAFRIGIGHSLGGTFVLNSLIDRPNFFNAYIAISPNLQLDDEEIVLKIARNAATTKQSNKFLFATMGTSGHPDIDFLPSLEKLDSVLAPHQSDHFNWSFSTYKNFTHATTPTESIHRGLLELSKKWKVSTIQQHEMLAQKNSITAFTNHFQALSDWTGYECLPSIHDYYDFGYALEKQQKWNTAIALYKLAVQHYAIQSQLYNQIGENYLKTDDKVNAKEYFQLALKQLEKQKEQFEYVADYHYYKKRYQQNLDALIAVK